MEQESAFDWNAFWDSAIDATPGIIDRFHLGPARERELALEEHRLAIQRDVLAYERATGGGGGMQLDPTMLAMIGAGVLALVLIAR